MERKGHRGEDRRRGVHLMHVREGSWEAGYVRGTSGKVPGSWATSVYLREGSWEPGYVRGTCGKVPGSPATSVGRSGRFLGAPPRGADFPVLSLRAREPAPYLPLHGCDEVQQEE